MLAVEICREYKWTYGEFLEQPRWFIDLIIERMKIDNTKPKAPRPPGAE